MPGVKFDGPIQIGIADRADITTNTAGYVPAIRIGTVNFTSPSLAVRIPPCVITKLGFVPTSAFTGTDPVSAMNITFSNGDITLGVVTASAATRYHQQAVVSGAVIDVTANLTITLSALSTTVFTGGGGRAFVEFIKTV